MIRQSIGVVDRFSLADASSPSRPLQPLYDGVFEQVEPRTILALTVAAVVGVCVFHFGAGAIVRVAFPGRFRQTLARDCLFYIAGLQVVLVGVAYFGLASTFRFDRDLTPGFALNVKQALHDLVHAMTQAPLWAKVIRVLLAGAIVLAPLPILLALCRRSTAVRRVVNQYCCRSAVLGLVLLLFVDLVWIASFASADFVRNNIQPLAKPPYEIVELRCDVRRQGSAAQIDAVAILSNTGRQPLLFAGSDLQLSVGGAQLARDPAPINKGTDSPKSAWVSRPLQASNFAGLSGRDTVPLLIEPGRFAAVRLIANLDEATSTFLKSHPKYWDCTLRDAGPGKIGRHGPLLDNDNVLGLP